MSAEKPLAGKVAVVTGAARGIGKQIAIDLAMAGADIVGNSVDPKKGRRVQEVITAVQQEGRRIEWVFGDVTDNHDRYQILGRALELAGNVKRDPTIDFVFLNAAGGLESDKPDGWAKLINDTAQVDLVNTFRDNMSRGGGFVNIASLWSEGFGEVRQLPYYRPVAKSKHAGEIHLREMIPDLSRDEINMWFLCGNLIRGTGAETIFERSSPELISRLKKKYQEQTGALDFPTVEDMGKAAVTTLISGFRSGHIEYVGPMVLEPIPANQKYAYTLNRRKIEQRLPMYGRKAPYNKLYVETFSSPNEDEAGDAKETGTAWYEIRKEETAGHFTGPLKRLRIFRGVDQIEMAAQVGGLIILGLEEDSGVVPLFTDIQDGEVHWRKMIEPGELVRVEARLTSMNPSKTRVSAEIYGGNGKLASSFSGLTFALVPNIEAVIRLKERQKA